MIAQAEQLGGRFCFFDRSHLMRDMLSKVLSIFGDSVLYFVKA
jgi:hypothetical protein